MSSKNLSHCVLSQFADKSKKSNVILTRELFTTPNEQLPFFVFVRGLSVFVFYYPLFMAYLWMWGGLIYYWWYERYDHHKFLIAPILPEYPFVTIIIPCYNEEANVLEVIGHLMVMNYPNYEVIAVNDGSKDNTGRLLDSLAAQFPKLRVIHQALNQGKAVGLNTATVLAKGEHLLCIDGDAVLDHDAILWMVRHFLRNPFLGAVTGNPRIRTRSSLLGAIQVGEFSAIIGLIKRTQHVYGQLFCVSGVCSMFKRAALLKVDMWSPDMLTEDIDISWKLQLQGYEMYYEPRALCWILMPETLMGLWKQRLRWAMGGIQVIFNYKHIIVNLKYKHMWPIWYEYVTSIIWSYCMAFIFGVWVYSLFTSAHLKTVFTEFVPGWHGVVLGTTCLLQFFISISLERRYDYGLRRHYFWIIWYPLAYWLLTTMTTLYAIPKTLLRKSNARATWVSPDRGLQNAKSVSDV